MQGPATVLVNYHDWRKRNVFEQVVGRCGNVEMRRLYFQGKNTLRYYFCLLENLLVSICKVKVLGQHVGYLCICLYRRLKALDIQKETNVIPLGRVMRLFTLARSVLFPETSFQMHADILCLGINCSHFPTIHCCILSTENCSLPSL